jgi:hypothetical protein
MCGPLNGNLEKNINPIMNSIVESVAAESNGWIYCSVPTDQIQRPRNSFEKFQLSIFLAIGERALR